MKYYVEYLHGTEIAKTELGSLHELACFVEKHDLYDKLHTVVEGTVIDNRVVVDTVEQLLGKNDSPNQPM